MELLIEPYIGVGNIKFGFSKEEIHSILGNDYTESKSLIHPKKIRNLYTKLGIHINYNENGKVEFVELLKPAEPIYNEKRLLKESFKFLCNWFKNLDQGIIIDDEGLKSLKLGIGLYVPADEEYLKNVVQTVYLFEKDFYTKQKPFSVSEYMRDKKPATIDSLKKMVGL